jgi:subtilisin-like proprotein convertase family protein
MNSKKLLAPAVMFAALALAQSATAQCVPGGASGLIPASGTGGNGVFPGTLPPSPMVSTLAVTVPSGATVLKSLKLNGTSHTYLGDVQFVLQNPAGGLYNIYCGQTSAGNVDLNGDYELVDPIALAPNLVSGGNPVVNGTYSQDYGAFTNGSAGINNTPIEQIPIGSGVWTLYAYDWAAVDVGGVSSWELCFGLPTPPPPPPPTVTCVPNGAGAGAIPASGTGGNGVWPGTLPPTPFVSTQNVTVPAGSTKIGKVDLVGMSHTWTGDLQIVLTDPSGTQHNLLTRPGSTGGGVGLNCDLAGDYAIYQAGQANWNCSGTTHTPGSYNQLFGSWNSGDLNIFNTARTARRARRPTAAPRRSPPTPTRA